MDGGVAGAASQTESDIAQTPGYALIVAIENIEKMALQTGWTVD